MTWRRSLLGGTLAVVVGVGAGSAVSFLTATDEQPPADEVVKVAGARSDSARGVLGGPATRAQLRPASPMAVEPSGDLLIAQSTRIVEVGRSGRLRLWPAPAGEDVPIPRRLVATGDGRVLGQGHDDLFSYERRSGAVRSVLTSETVGTMYDLAVAADGTVYVATDDNRVYALDAGAVRAGRVGDNDLRVVAGTGAAGFAGDGGPATEAMLDEPSALTVTGDGTVYVADSGNRRIRAIDPDGTIDTVAGGPLDPACATGSAVDSYVGPVTAMLARPDGSVLVAETRSREQLGFRGQVRLRVLRADGGLAELDPGFLPSQALTTDAAGNAYASAMGTGEVYRIPSSAAGRVTPGACREVVAPGQVDDVTRLTEAPALHVASLGRERFAYATDEAVYVSSGGRGRRVFEPPADAEIGGIAPAGDQLLVWCGYSGGDPDGAVLFLVDRRGDVEPLVTSNAGESFDTGLPLRGEGVSGAAYDARDRTVVFSSGSETFRLDGTKLDRLPWDGDFSALVRGEGDQWYGLRPTGSESGVYRLSGDGAEPEPVITRRSSAVLPPYQVVPTLSGNPDDRPDVGVTDFGVAGDGTVYALPQGDLAGLLLRVRPTGGTDVAAGDGTAGPIGGGVDADPGTGSIGRPVDVAVDGDTVYLAGAAGVVRVRMSADE
ncbi:MAG: PQQ-binding-like beta-propeller repeat protein [Streptosporangiales bacterium]|nr:PQQ-binding-like beta-propeller repeat protein [Streptosporangiales bacterium]